MTTPPEQPKPEQPKPPEQPEPRISDADRERAVEQLQAALAEGRLELTEFDERVAGVLRSRTATELVPYLADLPGALTESTVPEHQELRTTMSSLKRTGRWLVPRKLSVQCNAASVKLDFTEAVIATPVIEVEVHSNAGSTMLVVPNDTSVNVDDVELVAGSAKVRGLPVSTTPTGRLHLVVKGRQSAGSLTVRRKRRFLWWRW